MPFLIVKAIVPVKYSHVQVLCMSGAPLVTSSVASRLTTHGLDMQSSYTLQLASYVIRYLATNVNATPCFRVLM